MKFFTDQDVYLATTQFLRAGGHDVLTAAEAGLATAPDHELLAEARRLDRVFVTRDRDFGGLIFVQRLESGVIYLRMTPATVESTHAELERVLGLYDQTELGDSFVVIEPGRHRIRQVKP